MADRFLGSRIVTSEAEPSQPPGIEPKTAEKSSNFLSIKEIGPLSVTFDIIRDNYNQFLTCSIHYFDIDFERKNVVCLRKLSNNQLDANNILTSILDAVRTNFHPDIRISNLMCPNESIYNIINYRENIQHFYVCFYHYMSKFVTKILEIGKFAFGLDELRRFVRLIYEREDFYEKFKDIQKSKHVLHKLPKLEDGTWKSTFIFLTECLKLHETFIDLCNTSTEIVYIRKITFSHLCQLRKLLQLCTEYCRILRTSPSSISRIVPTIEKLRIHIEMLTIDRLMKKLIRNSLNSTFFNFTGGLYRHRYELAVLLDPRFAYRDFWTLEKWKSLETMTLKLLISDWPRIAHCYPNTISMSCGQRCEAIRCDFMEYRRIVHFEALEEAENPFIWWREHQEKLKFLSVLAKDCLVCPPVTLDASEYFLDEGKFVLNNYQAIFEEFQEFHGKGASPVDQINPQIADSISTTVQFKLHPKQSIESQHPEVVRYSFVSGIKTNPLLIKKPVLLPPKIIRIGRAPKAIDSPPIELRADVIKEEADTNTEKEIKFEPMGYYEENEESVVDQANHNWISNQTGTEIKNESSTSENYNKVYNNQELTNSEAVYGSTIERHKATIIYGQSKLSQNRRCSACKTLINEEYLKSVTIESEKFLLMMISVRRKRLTMLEAATVMFNHNNRIKICIMHLSETIDEIYSMFQLRNHIEFNKCSTAFVQHAMRDVSPLRPFWTPLVLKLMIRDFLMKYSGLQTAQEGNIQVEPLKIEPNDTDNDRPIPKEYRVPRKQKLEDDQNYKPIKVMKQEIFEEGYDN